MQFHACQKHEQENAHLTKFADETVQFLRIRNNGQAGYIQQGWPQQYPRQQFSKHGGLTQPGAEIPSQFGNCQDQNQLGGKLQKWREFPSHNIICIIFKKSVS